MEFMQLYCCHYSSPVLQLQYLLFYSRVNVVEDGNMGFVCFLNPSVNLLVPVCVASESPK